MPAPESSDSDQRAAYLAEYKIVADRYENIYKAIWQHFSYMAALAAGIVAFGTRDGPSVSAAFAAGTPLLFWFYASYLPMDHYARSARKRASEIEARLNEMLFHSDPEPQTLPNQAGVEPPRAKGSMKFGGWMKRWSLAIAFVILSIGLLAIQASTAPVLAWQLAGAIACTLVLVVSMQVVSLCKGNEVSRAKREQDSVHREGLRHFEGFGDDDPTVHWGKINVSPYYHVNQVVVTCFLLLTFLWIASIPGTIQALEASGQRAANRQSAPDTIAVRLLQAQLDSDSVAALMRQTRAILQEFQTNDSTAGARRAPVCSGAAGTAKCP